jgi:hypothetical protein
MALISIQFQSDDQQPISVNLPAQFTLDDFKRAATRCVDKPIVIYNFICCEKILTLDNETEFNKEKILINSGVTIFVEKRVRGCFLPDTLVRRADTTDIPIKDVKLGDVLLAFTDFGNIVRTTVEQIFIHEVNEYIEVRFGSKLLHVTGEHPFFIGTGLYCSLDKLSINDCVYSIARDKLESTSITNMKVVSAPTTRVYNIRTTEPHTYFANGIAVHNKFGQTFVNLNNTSGIQRIPWSLSAPSWRRARPGICIEGRCHNGDCEASGELVIINLGITKFNFLDETNEEILKCPVCSKYVGPITCAFTSCYWRYEGRVQNDSNSPPKAVIGEWKHADNAYHRFNETISGTVQWLRLVIEATSKIN